MVANLALRNMISECISDTITFPNENFEYGYPNANALVKMQYVVSRFSGCQLHKTTCRPMKSDVTTLSLRHNIAGYTVANL